MRFGSLFSGIGGLDLGLERAGMTCAWQVEIDDYCRQVLAKHWPDVPRFADVKDVDATQLESVDLICGGFPCQPNSYAGKQAGRSDSRWLWPEFARLVRDLRPRYVLVENVPGLLTVEQGRAAQEVFGNLAEYGFDAEWASIPAAAVGAPHLRYRVLVVATRTDSNRGRFEELAKRNSDPAQATANGHSRRNDANGLRNAVADPNGSGRDRRAGIFGEEWRSEDSDRHWWATEPDVGRVANGVPRRVDRLRGLGNAVVPQVAEWVGRRILEADS